MKKAIIFLILFALLAIAVGVSANAESADANPTDTAVTDTDTAEQSATPITEGYNYTYSVCETDGVYYFMKDGAVSAASEELSELLAPLSRLGEPIYLDGVATDKPLSLAAGEYRLTGSLTLGAGLTVTEGAGLTLSALDVELKVEPISVSGGTLVIESGKISADGVAVSLSLTSSARLDMHGGEIVTSSSLPALDIVTGAANLYGGSITNGAGAAISDRGTLRLAGEVTVTGASFGIVAYNPLWASVGEERFSSRTRIRYMESFEDGTRTEVVLGAAEDMTECFSLVDKSGREYPLTYNGGSLCVYLPYSVRFVAQGVTVASAEVLKGECVPVPDYTAPSGYTLSGWYTDTAYKTRYDFAEEARGELTLYAGCTLNLPQYSLQSLSFTYDTEAHTLAFTELYHTLDGIYTYEWLDGEGRTVATSDSLTACEVKDSGIYKCKVSFTFGSDTVTLETPYVEVAVSPAVITAPTVPSAVYNGGTQYPHVVGQGFNYTAEGFTEAGRYYVTLYLNDTENTVFEGGLKSIAVPFDILQADNSWTSELSVSDIYYGAEIKAHATAKFGAAQLLYSKAPSGEYSPTAPTEVGEYYVKAVVPETDSYKYLESEPISFSILRDRLVSFTVLTYQTVGVYSAFDCFNTDGLSFLAGYTSGATEAVYPDSVRFSYMTADSFRTADSGIIAEYMGQTLLLPVTVLPREYEAYATLTDASFIYNGEYHTLTLVGELPVGLDGISPTYRITGGGTDVGEYTVTLEFFTESHQYTAPKPVTAKLTVTPREVAVEWGECEFVYDGRAKCPTAFYTDIYGARVALSVSGAASLAGVGYTAVAHSQSPNYALLGASTSFNLLRADYDLSGVYWSITEVAYNGEPQTVRLCGLPDGVTVSGYVNNTATGAGVYFARAILTYDTANYNAPDIPLYEWRITPIPYDTAGFDFIGGSFVYDGSAHYPTLTGSMPTGLDGGALSYVFSRGVTGVTESGTVTVTFISGSANYVAPEPREVSLTALPLGINVVWSGVSLTYNSREQAPVATAAECAVLVRGAKTDVGEYVADAYTDNANYTVLNSKCSYRITPAPNLWTEQLSVSDIFLGQTPHPTAEALFGSVKFTYYCDGALTREAELPLSVGEYYVVASADAGSNYLPLTSEPQVLRVIAIIPVLLEVEGGGEYVAFDTVREGDFKFTVVNNDGTREEISLSGLSVSYECADSFRRGDSLVTFGYSGISVSVAVEVGYAEYDTSGVHWVGLNCVYDGTGQYPTLAGLPKGVTVAEYVGAGAVNAGEYEVSARLSYDEENYLAPSLPRATLVIEKMALTPSCSALIYNGRVQYPVADSPLYTAESVGYTRAGSYTVKITLADPDNYLLTSDTAEFTILPLTLSVTVGDGVEYWLAPMRDFSMEITDGEVIEGDDLMLRYYVEDGRIFVTTDNPDYRLRVSSGRLDSRLGFAPSTTRIIFIWLLFLMLVCCMTVVLVLRREAILVYITSHRSHRGESEEEAPPRIPMGEYLSVDVERAEELITDGIAKTLIRDEEYIFTEGKRRVIINVDTLSEHFIPGERVDINVLKARGLIPADAGYLKVLGRGVIDKPLTVYANAFSLSAVKMLALTGGEVYRVRKS